MNQSGQLELENLLQLKLLKTAVKLYVTKLRLCMVKKLLNLQVEPKPDHASDALAAAICYTTHEGYGGAGGADALAKLEARGRVMAGAGTGGAAGAVARKILEEGAR